MKPSDSPPPASSIRGVRAWRVAIASLALALYPTWTLALLERIEFSAEGTFTEDAVVRGVRASAAQCASVPNAVWAAPREASAGAECIKFWAAGFDGPSAAPPKRAIAYFAGDVFLGPGQTPTAYLAQSDERLQAEAQEWSRRLGVPYVFIGRPGTYGSSGDHMQRRRIGESLLMSAALDQLKQRLGVSQWVVAGQSGGGHVTSALVAQRGDIVCAVPASAVSSPRIRWELKGLRRDTTGHGDAYEPTRFIDKARSHPSLRVFVLGNPLDTNVPWPSQTAMADALRRADIPVAVLEGQGSGPAGHGLGNSARRVAGWCARDMPTDEIVARAARGLKG